MFKLTTSALLFPLWLVVGVWIYVAYGYKKKRVEAHRKQFLSKK